jgi:hypothetical protein
MPPHPLLTLECLALEECGKSVARILHLSATTEEEKYKQIIQACESLHELPSSLANDITAVMLRYLEPQWLHLDWPTERMHIVTISAIHPKVKTFDITSCPDIGKYVMAAIIQLPNLLQRFPNCNTLRNVNVNITLKKFICERSCDDQTLDALKLCTGIEYLDVRTSWEVTDKSVSTLLDLTHLKYLDIDGTSISQNGLSELLQEFCTRQMVSPLCRFYCSDISTEQMRLLIRCTNLTHIGMGISNCDIDALKSLEYLKSVRLRVCRFDSLRKTFHDVRYKLCEIHLERIEQVDVNFIGETFPNLESLKLISCSYLSLAASGGGKTVPAFQTLRILKIVNIESEPLSYLLKTFRNLIEFELDTRNALDESFNEILASSLERVEKLVLYTRNNRILSKSSVEELFRNSTCLKVFKNLGIEREDLNIESLKEEIRQTYPLTDVTVTATRWSSLPVS